MMKAHPSRILKGGVLKQAHVVFGSACELLALYMNVIKDAGAGPYWLWIYDAGDVNQITSNVDQAASAIVQVMPVGDPSASGKLITWEPPSEERIPRDKVKSDTDTIGWPFEFGIVVILSSSDVQLAPVEGSFLRVTARIKEPVVI